MSKLLSTRPALNDKTFLLCMIEYAIAEIEHEHGRMPTREEILDHLFSATRDDPEARALEEKLDSLLRQLVGEKPKGKRVAPAARKKQRA